MKELTIEEKARAYDEAIEKLKIMHNDWAATQNRAAKEVEEAFPELKESEDEKIRKDIISALKWANHKGVYDKHIAWLEKQGEQPKEATYTHEVVTGNGNIKALVTEKVQLPKFKVGDKIHCKLDDRTFVIKEVDLEKGEYLYTKSGCGNDINYADETFELVEQNTAWSKEDERIILAISQLLKDCKSENGWNCVYSNDREVFFADIENYLQSLKNRIISQPKQEWKQENTDDLTDFENAMMHIGGSFFGQYAGLDPNDTNAIKEQANLLLELVPKQEWSEENEARIKQILGWIDTLKNYIHYDTVVPADLRIERIDKVVKLESWLKSLMPQNRWKPSGKQMETLEYYLHTLPSTGYKEVLSELYDDLKQLK